VHPDTKSDVLALCVFAVVVAAIWAVGISYLFIPG